MTISVPRRLALACQGGGSHTAFSAGALARFFDVGAVTAGEVVGISGTSGGAINALITWSCLVRGRPDEVGDALAGFWADNAASGPLERWLNVVMVGAGVGQNLGLVPPLNPHLLPPALDGREEFRRLLRRHVDFDALPVDSEGRHPRLVLGAVEILSGRFRAFDSRRDRITPDTVLASAAIPTLFRGIRVGDGVHWDGLFSQNPPVSQLVDDRPDELWVLQINPSRIDREPRTTLDIAERRNELAGNLSLNQELHGIERTDRLLESGALRPDSGYRPIMVRVLEMPRVPDLLGAASKLNRDPAFLARLRRDGATQADRFLVGIGFEKAWLDGDVSGLEKLLLGASITVSAPFEPLAGDPVHAAAELLARDVTVDVTRKQLAGAELTWSVRVTRPDGTRVEGAATATVADDGIATFRLGPADEA
ncbi:patatin-like phospholipase family protein [Actinomycetospora termitidis]|uniref:Patatin-like phospholipase family protein n=1 Tax=Actinomycetospora termitidis TaxID=3053470 RepID=A0ABT7MHE3_9PSEU|nr:patatin-like phospholipase family protein [Actinomycetospora sp. Odt1-22]MDL5160070.1 patatin-like phospholipase family protein [Actinomycetospora sp. Odt1-22]